MRFLKATLAAWICLLGVLIVQSSAAEKEAKIRVVTVDPWSAQIFRFIAGSTADVDSVEYWNGRRGKASVPNGEGSIAVAFDLEQGKRRGWFDRNGKPLQKNVVLLYPQNPIPGKSIEEFFLDPANLPFVAQRVLTILSQIAPRQYNFYQRRLGEFETRLHSTLVVGRSMLKGCRIMMFGRAYEAFFRAVGCDVAFPAPEEIASLSAVSPSPKNASFPTLGGRILLVDFQVDSRLREKLKNYPRVIELPPPEDKDPLLFFHQTFLKIGDVLRKTRS